MPSRPESKHSGLGRRRPARFHSKLSTPVSAFVRAGLASAVSFPFKVARRNLKHARERLPPQVVRWDLIGVMASYLWGSINGRQLPTFLRPIVYKTWSYLFRVNMDEIPAPLESYSTLKAFFSRALKEGARTIVPDPDIMVSPVDGRVIVFGEVTADRVEQVKGVTYPISGFLGHALSKCKARPNTKLYHCVIYLAPGDYHRIHSPDDWEVKRRRHFPGTLFPISPVAARVIPNLFALNERVVLLGTRKDMFMSMTAVGALNVGSITLNFDEEVVTNSLTRDYTCPNLRYLSFGGMGTHAYEKIYRQPVHLQRGEEVGLFNLGSTVVLIFEAEHFEFSVKPGDHVSMGSALGVERSARRASLSVSDSDLDHPPSP